MRAVFLNENLGGHAVMHRTLRESLAAHPHVEARFVDVAGPGLVRRVVGAQVPGLARLDLDLQPLRYLLAQGAVARRAVRRLSGTYDVLHVYSHNAGLLLASEIASLPSVVSTDCTNEQNARTLPYRRPTKWTDRTLGVLRRFEERVYAGATLIVAQSQWAADSLVGDYAVPADRVRVIRFGIVPPRPHERVATDLPEITFVGRSMDRKGGWQLLQLHQRHFLRDAALNLVTLDAVPARDNVRVLGDVTTGDGQVEKLLARTAVFAFPSEIDKSSYAVLEAMGMGVPVVAYRAGAIAELVDDGVTGYVVDTGDEAAFGAALRTLLEDVRLREQMGAAARERVREHFDARVSTARLVGVLEEAEQRFAASRASRAADA